MKTPIKNLLLLLLLLGLPAVVQAQVAYSTNADGSANIVAYAGPPWVVTIPTNINDLTVTTIGPFAFAGDSLTSVTIPSSVTGIGTNAFFQCISLTSVHFTGNAPSPTNDSTAFSAEYPYYDPATVYYLPGTTGWGAMFDGRPTAPWFPNPRISNNGNILLQFSGGVPGTLYAVEESSDLLTWTVAATDPANAMGSFSFEDTATAGVLTRFYRAASAYTVGGTLTGLPAGDTVTLQDNGSDNLTLSANGPFTFPTALPNGQSYSVTYRATSSRFGAYTFFTNGSGTISGANVTNVAVTFTPAYTGNPDVDMLNAAVADGTDHGGVPGVMLTEYGGPILVTAIGPCTHDVALLYSGWARFATIVAPGSCSSTTFPVGTHVIQFGTAFACQPDDIYGY